MKLLNIQVLTDIGNNFNQNRLLFGFKFCEIDFKIILLTNSNSLLISASSLNVAHIVNFESDGNFNGKLPPEFYYAVRDKIIEHSGEDKITQLWKALDAYINQLEIENITEITEEELTEQLKKSKTKDKKYDPDGEKPFFETWVRNSSRNVKDENLLKTQRYFGNEIKNLCEKNNISSRWKDSRTSKSFCFLEDIDKTKQDIKSAKSF